MFLMIPHVYANILYGRTIPSYQALTVCMPALLANCDVDDGRSCAAFTGEDAGSSGMGFHSTGAGSEEVGS